MFIDVIRGAETEHEIYFLLTAYIQSVRYSDRLRLAPDLLARLPLHGMSDVQSRFGALVPELDKASRRLDGKGCVLIREALNIFGTALDRLTALELQSLRPPSGAAAQPANAARDLRESLRLRTERYAATTAGAEALGSQDSKTTGPLELH